MQNKKTVRVTMALTLENGVIGKNLLCRMITSPQITLHEMSSSQQIVSAMGEMFAGGLDLALIEISDRIQEITMELFGRKKGLQELVDVIDASQDVVSDDAD